MNRGGRRPGSLSPNSSSDAQIRSVIRAIDLDGNWPTANAARQRGMHMDNDRFAAIRNEMHERGELGSNPTGPQPRKYMHAPGKLPALEKPKEKPAWTPQWARVPVQVDDVIAERLASRLDAFLSYRRAWQRLEVWPVDFFSRIEPRVAKKKRKRVNG